jgi:hypothetical protein
MGDPPADAVMLLGDVGEVEKVREGARQQQHRLDRHRRERSGEPLEGGGVAGACRFGQCPHLLDGPIELVALAGAEGATKQESEQAHIFTERLIVIVVHFSTIVHLRPDPYVDGAGRTTARARKPPNHQPPSPGAASWIVTGWRQPSATLE